MRYYKASSYKVKEDVLIDCITCEIQSQQSCRRYCSDGICSFTSREKSMADWSCSSYTIARLADMVSSICSSIQANLSAVKTKHCAKKAPRRTSYLCVATCLIFLRVDLSNLQIVVGDIEIPRAFCNSWQVSLRNSSGRSMSIPITCNSERSSSLFKTDVTFCWPKGSTLPVASKRA